MPRQPITGTAPTATPDPLAREAYPLKRRTASSGGITLENALTTIFTRDEQCNPPILSVSKNTTLYSIRGTFDSTVIAFNYGKTSCYPDEFFLSAGYSPLYSPGVCPSAMPSAGGSVVGSTTYAICCPTGAQVYDTLCSFQLDSVTIESDGVPTVLDQKFDVQTEPVHVAWQSSDLSRFTPASAPILPASNSASSTSVTSTSKETIGPAKPAPTSTSPEPSTAASGGSNGLSTGAKAGIGVGVALGALIIIALVIWGLMQRRKLKKQVATQTQQAAEPHNSMSTFQGYGSPGQQSGGFSSIGELSPQDHDTRTAGLPPAEMNAYPERTELEGEWQGIVSPPVYK